MTVGELKKQLEVVPDNYVVAVPDPTDATNAEAPAAEAYCCRASSLRVLTNTVAGYVEIACA
jgi:hypothetical protein